MKNLKSILFFILLLPLTALSFDLLQHELLKFEQLLSSGSTEIVLDHPVEIQDISNDQTRTIKPWTFIVYMAADNDLRAFAANNLKQMASVGSNINVNIVVHLDIKLNGNQKVTRRYYIQYNKIIQMNHDQATQKMDSGDPETLISCCKWAINNYPAQNYALIMWNHGTGIIDPRYFKIINPAELFTFNPLNNRFELDRSIPFLDLLNYIDIDQRGICWDTTTGNYLTNQKFEFALKEICDNVIHGKFKLLGFDACLMSMIEVAHYTKEYAEIFVGSQEVELGTGWNYTHILEPLAQSGGTPEQLAQHIVNAYARSYQNITNDFTQSAIDLRKINLLESNLDLVGTLLIECLSKQKNNSVKNAITESRNKRALTHFDEPSYVDLYHLYSNLQANIGKFKLTSNPAPISRLTTALDEGKKLITQIAFANTCGKNLKNAHGISIYFPDQQIHSSYSKSRFAQENSWSKFLQRFRN